MKDCARLDMKMAWAYKKLLATSIVFTLFLSVTYAQGNWQVLVNHNFNNASGYVGSFDPVFPFGGMSLGGYGSSGNAIDTCFSGNFFNAFGGSGISMKYTLEAGQEYRIAINAKAVGTSSRTLKFGYGNTPTSLSNVINSTQNVPLVGNQTDPGQNVISATFTPPATGTYWLTVESGIGPAGLWYLDNFRLGKKTLTSNSPSFSTYTQTSTAPVDTFITTVGTGVDVCIAVNLPLNNPDTLEIRPSGNGLPHFNNLITNLPFPENDTTLQCFTVTPSSDWYSSSHQFEVRRSNGDIVKYFTVNVLTDTVCNDFAGPDVTIDEGDTTSIGTSCLPAPHPYYGSTYTYNWSPQSGLTNAQIAQPEAFPDSTQAYSLELRQDGVTIAIDTVLITVNSLVDTTTTEPNDTTGLDSVDTDLPLPEALSLKLLAASVNGKIRLRWVPLNYDSWGWGNRYGFKLERILYGQGDTLVPLNTSTVLDSMLVPAPESEWEPFVQISPQAGIAAAALYGEDFIVEDLSQPGDIFQAYNVTQKKQNRFGFGLFAADQSFPVAKAMGLAFDDDSAIAGKSYIYRLKFNGVPDTVHVGRAIRIAGLSDTLSLPKPEELIGTGGDHRVSIQWSFLGMEQHYSSFDVERSQDGINFDKVNTTPIVFTAPVDDSPLVVSFQDSLSSNDQVYIYRVKGYSPFGLYGPVSDTIHVKGKPKPLPYRPFINQVWEFNEGNLRIEWEFELDTHTDEIDGFNILRADYIDGPYEQINTAIVPVNTRIFNDLNPLRANYYKVVALDANGYELASFPALGQIDDTTPPDPPEQPTCLANIEGSAIVTWPANTEEDIMGYRVYTCNQPEGEYMELTKTWVRDTFFWHSINLNTLADSVYYKIVALDNRQNASDWSPIGVLERPDIIPPSPPVISKIEPRIGYIKIKGIGSSSEDLVQHELQRKKNQGYLWETISVMQAGEAIYFEDSTASYQYNYDYRLLAVDDAGLKSSSKILTARPLASSVRGEVLNLRILIHTMLEQDSAVLTNLPVLTVNPSNNLLQNNFQNSQPGQQYLYGRGESALIWEFLEQDGIYGYQIYRSASDGILRPYRMVKPDEGVVTLEVLQKLQERFGAQAGIDSSIIDGNHFFFFDSGLKKGTAYTYRVEAQYFDGAVSPLSESVIVIY